MIREKIVQLEPDLVNVKSSLLPYDVEENGRRDARVGRPSVCAQMLQVISAQLNVSRWIRGLFGVERSCEGPATDAASTLLLRAPEST